MLDLIKYILLGILQGFTEPLPISSSGHLVLLQDLFNIKLPGIVFEAIVNFGSMIAIVIYFRKDILELIIGFFGYLKTRDPKYKPAFEYSLKLVVATIPIVVAGVLLFLFDIEFGDSVIAVGFALLITGTLLLIVTNKNGKRTVAKLTYLSILFIGLGQAIAIFPGISRSGVTLVFALLVLLQKEEAFKFSFLMYLPASIGAACYALLDIGSVPTSVSQYIYYIISAIFAGIFTYFAVKLFKRVVINNNLKYFSVYCFIVGTLVLVVTL